MAALAALTVSLHFLYQSDYRAHSVFAQDPISDARGYHEAACKLAKGVPRAGSALTGLTVGYPLLLSAIYHRAGCRADVARVVQSVVGIGVVAAVVVLGWLLFGPLQGVLSGLLLVLYGPMLFYETKLLPTVWAVFVVMLSLLALEFARRKSLVMAWVAGLCLGLASLLRPNLALFPLFLVVSWSLEWRRAKLDRRISVREPRDRRTWRALLLGGAGLVLGLLPGAVMFKAATGQWHLFPATGGVTLLGGNHEGAKGVYEPAAGFKGDKAQQMEQSARLASKLDAVPHDAQDPYRDSRILTLHVVHWIVAHPAKWAKLTFLKMYRFLLSSEPRSAYSFRFERRHVPSLILAFVPWSFLAVFGLLGLIVTWRSPEIIPLRALTAVVWLTSLVFFVSSRYRVVAAPSLAIFSSVGIVWLAQRKKRSTSIILAGILAGAVVFFSWDPFDQPRRLEAVDAFNRALVYRRAGDHQRALVLLDRASKLSRDAAVYGVEKGNTLVAMGRTRDARRIYEQVLDKHPGSADAWANMAVLDWRAGRLAEAYGRLRRAVSLRPGDAKLRLHLARLALRLDRLSEAERWAESVLRGPADAEIRHWAEIVLDVVERRRAKEDLGRRGAGRKGGKADGDAGPAR